MLKVTEKEAFALVYEKLRQVPLFTGRFDAKNGNVNFMYGINTVMEVIAAGAGKEKEQDAEFMKNFTKSLKSYWQTGQAMV